MKIYNVIFILFILGSCCEKEVIHDFVSIYDVAECQIKTGKPSMVCLVNNDDDIRNIRKNKFITSHFTCYVLNKQAKNILTKIVYPSTYPLYIIFKNDSIFSLLNSYEMNEFSKIDNVEQSHRILLSEKYGNRDTSDVAYMNVLLKLYGSLIKENDRKKMNLINSEKLIIAHDKFYGKYLLAQFYKDIDVVKSEEMYNDLWSNSTSHEISEYPEEFIDILKNKNHIALVDKKDIEFDYKEYDLGEVSLLQEATCKFYYTNRSELKFVIHNISTTCGCTVPFWNKQPINTNTRDSISVKFKAKDVGIIHKTIIIEGNCKQKIELKIKAVITG